MDKINAWAMVVCICSVIACLAEMLIPDAKYEKTVRAVIGCLMLCAFIDPLKELMYEGDISLPLKEYIYQEDNSPMAELQTDHMNEKLTEAVRCRLDEKGIEVSGLSVDVQYNDEYISEGISCSIELDGSQRDKTDEVRKTVRDVLGDKAKIIICSVPDM